MTQQTAFEAALAAFTGAGGDITQFQNASAIGQDRLVRKETSLGAIREIDPPMEHIGDQLAPWLNVETDDVIFDYLTVQTDGLAPARAEDAEAELAQKDQTMAGQGRASVIDWSLKDHYDASDVKNYVDLQRVAEQLRGGIMPLTVAGQLQDYSTQIARDRALRRRKLDNRREQLIMDAVFTNQIAYNDGKIKFTVPYDRPLTQTAGSTTFDVPAAGIVDGTFDMSGTSFDPIRFFTELSEWFYDTRGVRLGSAIGSKKIFNRFWVSDKFSQRAGLGGVYNGAGQVGPPDLLYAATGWSPNAARAVVEASTDMTFQEYDAVYRTRAQGSKTVVLNRFSPANRLVLLPRMSDLAEIANTKIGFGKTLSSPHPEGGWTSGFYEWERSTVDPWGQDVGNGVKMFPVFPHLDYTATVNIVLPS